MVNVAGSRYRIVLVSFILMSIGSVLFAHDWTIETLWKPDAMDSYIVSMFAVDHQNQLHAAIALSDREGTLGYFLSYFSRVGDEWQSEIVSDLPDSACDIHLSFDSSDTPHIICFDSMGIRVFKRESAVWHSEIVETDVDRINRIYACMFDSNDRMHVVFGGRANSLRHGIWMDSIWTSQLIDSESYSAEAAMGSDDVIRMVYVKYIPRETLYYATVSTEGMVVNTESVGQSPLVGSWAIALDSANNPYVAYALFTETADQMYLSYQEGGTWYHEPFYSGSRDVLSMVIDGEDAHVIILGADYALTHFYREATIWNEEHLDTDFNSPCRAWLSGGTGMLRLAYQNYPDLRYLEQNDDSWTGEYIACSAINGYLPSLAVDSSDHLYISHSLVGDSACPVHIAFDTDLSGDWNSTIVADKGMESSIAIAAGDQPVMVIAGEEALQFGRMVAGRWEFETLMSGGPCTETNIAVGPDGTIGISFDQRSPESRHVTYYAYNTGENWTIEPVAEYEFYALPTKLLIDAQGVPWLSHRMEDASLRCLYRSESGWVVDLDRSEVEAFDMELDRGGRICIVYQQIYWPTLYFMTRTAYGWEYEAIPNRDYYEFPDLVFDVQGNPHIMFHKRVFSTDQCSIEHFYKYNGTWSSERIVDRVNCSSGSDSVIDSSNVLHVVDGDLYGIDAFIHASTQLSPPTLPTPSAPVTGVVLEMPSHRFSPGDPCYLKATLGSDHATPVDAALFVILQIGSEYWFHPTWTHDLDWQPVTLIHGHSDCMILPMFDWPDTGNASLDGITFWGGMMNASLTELLGGPDGISSWTFGFGPR